jgi:hypothetical protein
MYEHKREKDAARVRGPAAFGIVTPQGSTPSPARLPRSGQVAES